MGVFKVILVLLGALLALAGLTGTGIYTTYTILPGPIYLRNNFIGVWLSILLTFYSLEFIYCVVKAEWRVNSLVSMIFNIGYYVLVTVGSLFLAIGYAIVWRADSFAFGLVIALVGVFSAAVLVIRRRTIIRNKLRPAAKTKSKRTLKATSEMEQSSTMSNIKLLDKESLASKKDTCGKTTLRVLNVFLKLFWLGVLVLLCMGAFEIGFRKFAYPARGKYITVALNDNSNRSISIHYLCDGPTNSSRPTFMFEGDGSHGHIDYLGLQRLLAKSGRRSCIWDKAGLGYSDFLYSDMKGNYSLYYDRFIRELAAGGEKAPFNWVAWGGGGSLVYSYAIDNPDMVGSITLLDAYPAQFEWTTPATLKNFTQDQLKSYINNDMMRRYLLVFLINDFGVPLGLMRYIYPTQPSQPLEISNERNWYWFTEKTWATQRYFLDTLRTEPDVFTKPLANQIVVNHIMSVSSDQQVVNKTCAPKKWTAESNECNYELRANRYSIDVRRGLVRAGGQIIECTMDECDQGYFIYTNPQFTIDSLLRIYQ